jgi:lipopolysaccharide export system protein LptA
MPVNISRLRHWFAAAAIAAGLIVGGAYFYARHRVQNALKQVPEKIGADIRQSAQGYTYSQSEQGRTLFKIQASKAIFKLNGRAELRDVAITLYGRDAGRFDQIYGSDFEYDTQSGDVTARGKVQIDLEANPAGLTHPDQTPPKELKNPIHLETSGLVFNQKTGDAHTQERVDFRISQASGSAIGVSYVSKSDALTFDSQVEITLAGPKAATVTAAHGTITKDPRVVLLQAVRMQQGAQRGDADNATLFLSSDNTLDRILAAGDVRVALGGKQPTQLHADQLELLLDQGGDELQTATFSGNVQMESAGSSPMKGSAGRVIASFSGEDVLNKVRAEENVRLLQPRQASAPSARTQTYELDAAAVNFFVAAGKRLSRAETSGSAQFRVQPTAPNAGQTLVTAARFTAQFDALGQLASVHGAPDARIVSTNPGQPDRVSTSLAVDANFSPGQGMETAEQQGNVVFTDGDRKAWADHARYTPANQILELSGSPRVLDRNMATTARILRMNRATGE